MKNKSKKNKTKKNKTKKNKVSKKINFNKKKNKGKKMIGGKNLHYIISSHGDIGGVTDYTIEYPGMTLYTYVEEYGRALSDDCAFNLQTYLTRYRDNLYNKPKCLLDEQGLKAPHMNSSVLNARVFVTPHDRWHAGIVDVSEISNPRVVQKWTYQGSPYEAGYTLNDAINTIMRDAEETYMLGRDRVKIHVLTCFTEDDSIIN